MFRETSSAHSCASNFSSPMKTMSQNTNGGAISPAVHLEFIENQLSNGNGSAAQEVEQYHRALFLHHHAVEWEKFRQVAKTHEDKLSFLEGRLKENDLALAERTKFVAVNVDGRQDVSPTSPWNA